MLTVTMKDLNSLSTSERRKFNSKFLIFQNLQHIQTKFFQNLQHIQTKFFQNLQHTQKIFFQIYNTSTQNLFIYLIFISMYQKQVSTSWNQYWQQKFHAGILRYSCNLILYFVIYYSIYWWVAKCYETYKSRLKKIIMWFKWNSW